MKKIYFGHPISEYNTVNESFLMEIIKFKFPGWHVENPNQPVHGDGYIRVKNERGNGMLYFYEEVLPSMDAGVFLAFEDEMFGTGVYKEAKFMADEGKPIYEISMDKGLSDLVLDESRMLSVEETRKRVYPIKKD
jgi:hypothetical protein